MKYHNSDFLHEAVFLRRTPTNRIEAYNKLLCLCELEKRFDPNANSFYVRPLSKRRERLVRMYWAFRKQEEAAHV